MVSHRRSPFASEQDVYPSSPLPSLSPTCVLERLLHWATPIGHRALKAVVLESSTGNRIIYLEQIYHLESSTQRQIYYLRLLTNTVFLTLRQLDILPGLERLSVSLERLSLQFSLVETAIFFLK